MRYCLLDQACELLRAHGVVRSRSDFSVSWLGQSECYFRTLHCRKAEPSLGVMAVCASRMQRAGEMLIATEGFRHVGERFLYVADKCHEIVNEDAMELELAA
ncbi:DUF6626 family protein [Novosphingobium humi]|uniref:DUF6626 family protein n=1 Tax=Novosphingobium humi TaxID=2282397 RepID=UPI0033907772